MTKPLIIGIGEAGFDSLAPELRQRVADAEIVIAAPRFHAQLPKGPKVMGWPSPFSGIHALIKKNAGRKLVLLSHRRSNVVWRRRQYRAPARARWLRGHPGALGSSVCRGKAWLADCRVRHHLNPRAPGPHHPVQAPSARETAGHSKGRKKPRRGCRPSHK